MKPSTHLSLKRMNKNRETPKDAKPESHVLRPDQIERTKTVLPSDVKQTDQIERRYKFGKKIGSGGFGDVYSALQTSPVRREVAIKVARQKLDPSDSREVLTRFKQEKQALAILNHEGIAQIYDAGNSKNGQPFFVMELVRGLPLTDYCLKHSLSLDARIRLLLRICNAVEHAHQKGIVHRDLKPANILVVGEASEPVVKVIDFGIAKILNPLSAGVDLTAVSQIGSQMGTYFYMSPEQAEIGERDIDTRTDIYSLGVILFELLTGTTPLQFALSSGNNFDPIHWIKNEDCVSMSACLDTISKSKSSTRRSSLSVAGIALWKVSADLDLIAQGAMEKDRDRRYSTVTEFADDLKRFLENEPIKRRPPSFLYTTQKLIAKNKGLFAAISAIAAALMIGLFSSLILWRQAAGLGKVILGQKNKLEASNSQLETTNKTNQKLLAQGSLVLVNQGINAWNGLSPQYAMAYFSQALALWKDNEQAVAWLRHTIQSHEQQGWNPPDLIIGGDADCKKVVLSQDGAYAAIQSKSTNQVSLFDIEHRRNIAAPFPVNGTVDDLFRLDPKSVGSTPGFLLLLVDKTNNQGSVWQWSEELLKQVSLIQNQGDYGIGEGQLEFSQQGKFLVVRIDQPKNQMVYQCSDGKSLSFDGEQFFVSKNDRMFVFPPQESGGSFRTMSVFDSEFREIGIHVFPAPTLETTPFPTPAPSTTPAFSDPEPGVTAPQPEPDVSDGDDDGTVIFPSSENGGYTSILLQEPTAEFSHEATPVVASVDTSQDTTQQLTGRVQSPTDSVVPEIVAAGGYSPEIHDGKFRIGDSAGLFFSATPYLNESKGASLLVSVFDIEKETQERVDVPLTIKMEDLYSDPNGTRRFQLFPSEFGNFAMIEQPQGSGGCGSGVVDCNNAPARLTLKWNGQLKTHSRSPAISVYDAVVDQIRPQMVLISRPIPTPQLQLFDFSTTESEPLLLSVPNVDFVSNDLETHFLGADSEFVVCRFAKNAIGVWKISESRLYAENEIETQMDRILDPSLNSSSSPSPYFYDWMATSTETADSSGSTLIPSIEFVIRTSTRQIVEPFEMTRWIPNTNGGRICYVRKSPTRMVEIIDSSSGTSIATIPLDFGFDSVSDVMASANGEFIAVVGSRKIETKPEAVSQTVDAGGRGKSVLASITVPEPVFCVVKISNGQVVQPLTSGRFFAFHPEFNRALFETSGLTVYDLDRLQLETWTNFMPGRKPIAACFSDNGDSIGIVNERNEFVHLSTRGFEELGVISISELPDVGVEPENLQFDSSKMQIRFTTKGLETYHANSQGCTNCGQSLGGTYAQLKRHYKVDLEAGIVSWYRNVIKDARKRIFTIENGQLIGYDGDGVPVFGPIPFNIYGDNNQIADVFLHDDARQIAVTSRNRQRWQPELGIPSTVDVWDTRKGVPLISTTAIPQGHTLHGFVVSEKTMKFFLFDRENRPKIIQRTRTEPQKIATELLAPGGWLDAFIGLSADGSNSDSEFSGLLREKFLYERVGGLSQLLANHTASDVPSKAVNLSFEHGTQLEQENEEPEKQSRVGTLQKSNLSIQRGVAFDDGALLQVANSRQWYLVFFDRDEYFALNEQPSNEAGEFFLTHAEFDLEYKISLIENQIFYRAENSTKWRHWREFLPLPSRQ